MYCPWETLRSAPLVFCEAELCSWVKEPANTWSNVGYLAVGVYLWLGTRGPLQRLFSLVAVCTGIGSAFYHASGSFLGMVADYTGMFLGTGAMTALNLRRWLHLGRSLTYAVFGIIAALLIGLAISKPDVARLTYVIAMPCCLIELRLFFSDRRRTNYRDYLIAWGWVLSGVLFWMLDLSRVWCDPNNHFINGHALWHFCTAASIFFFARFYRQFPSVSTE